SRAAARSGLPLPASDLPAFQGDLAASLLRRGRSLRDCRSPADECQTCCKLPSCSRGVQPDRYRPHSGALRLGCAQFVGYPGCRLRTVEHATGTPWTDGSVARAVRRTRLEVSLQAVGDAVAGREASRLSGYSRSGPLDLLSPAHLKYDPSSGEVK